MDGAWRDWAGNAGIFISDVFTESRLRIVEKGDPTRPSKLVDGGGSGLCTKDLTLCCGGGVWDAYS